MLCSKLTRKQSNNLYLSVLADKDVKALRELCKQDLFFLLTRGCRRKDIDRDWLYERCREVEAEPDGYLDLWAREHYKSTIITYGKSIQDILVDPNETIGIFSHTRSIAKGFLAQIMRELETNDFLKELFPDVLYAEPKRQAPKWSLDQGIIVKRTQNPKESTVEAHGLVDGQPTSRHYSIAVYDDVVTLESVTTPEQIAKVNAAWETSLNLGARGGRRRHIGTRYHLNDTYDLIEERGSAKARYHTPTDKGRDDFELLGEPVLLTKKELIDKRTDQGPYTFACQMLQNPFADKAMNFNKDWLMFYDKLTDMIGWNLYLLVDPANAKKVTSDYTVMWVVGLAPDKNYYLVDGLRDRLNLTERTKKLFEFHRTYPIKAVGYEKYGKDTDIEHIEYEMGIQNYRFQITALGGSMKKEDRIKKLVPVFEQARFWLPHKMNKITTEGKVVDVIKQFIDEEYTAFPVLSHDDMLDDMARILDPALGAVFPKLRNIPTPSITMDRTPQTVKTDYDVLAMGE